MIDPVAAELGGSTLQISPLDIEGTAEAMSWALDMPVEERQARLLQIRSKIERWTAADWLSSQLDALNVRPSRPGGFQARKKLRRSHSSQSAMVVD